MFYCRRYDYFSGNSTRFGLLLPDQGNPVIHRRYTAQFPCGSFNLVSLGGRVDDAPENRPVALRLHGYQVALDPGLGPKDIPDLPVRRCRIQARGARNVFLDR
jgi:hypothetical protein